MKKHRTLMEKKLKKNLIVLFTLLFAFNLVFAESNSETFWNLWESDKHEEAAEFLEAWEKKNKKDPELYVCYFNMYIMQASQEQMHLETFLPDNFDGEYMVGHNDSGDDIYIYSEIEYDDDLCLKAFEYIDKGLSYNPKRLDMYFGKAHLYSLIKDYKNQCELLKNVFELNKKNKSNWLWSNNTPAKKAGVDFESSMHEYILDWLSEKSEDSIKYAKDLSLAFIKYFPKNPVAYNDTAICCIYSNDLKAAKEYFKGGYELDNSDMIILTNLAYVCKNLGETEEAIKYYKLLEQSSDEEYSSMAKRELETLESSDLINLLEPVSED